MTTQHDDHNHDPFETILRRSAAEIHPRAAFVQGLRRELNSRQPTPNPWGNLVRRFLPQTAALVALAGLVALALFLTPQLVRVPGAGTVQQGTTLPGTTVPGQSPITSLDGLPEGALARLGLGQILSLDAAADGRLVVGSSLGVCLYDQGQVQQWCQQMGTPYDLGWTLFNPSGDRLAVAYNDIQQARVLVLDTADGSLLAEHPFPQTLKGFVLISAAIAWDPSGEPRIALQGEDETLLLWDWQADAVVWGPVDLQELGSGDSLFSIAWTVDPRGRSVLAAGGKQGILLLDGTTGQEIMRLDKSYKAAPVGDVSTLDFSADGSWLAYGYASGAAAVRIENNQVVDQRNWRTFYQPRQIAFDPKSSPEKLAVQEGGYISLFSIEVDTKSVARAGSGYGPLAWSPNGVLFFNRDDGMLGSYQDGQELVIPQPYTNWPEQIAWIGQQDIVALRGAFITRWDTRSAELSAVSTVTAPNPVALAVSADGTRAVFDLGGEFAGQVWDTASNQPLARIDPLDHKVHAQFSADNSRLVTVDRSGMLIVWDAVSGQKIREMQAAPPDTQIDALALSPDGIWAALGRIENGEPRLELWNLESAKVLGMIPLDTNSQSLAWSPDGQKLAESSSGYVTIWDPASGQKIQRMGPEPYGMVSSTITEPYVDVIRSLAWSPDGRSIATGGGIVTIWDAESGQSVKAFNGHRGYINDLAYRADGQVLASASNDGTILLWDTSFVSNRAPTATPVAETPTPLPYPIETVTPLETATPQAPIQYTVVEGDTCAGIAYTFDVSVSSLIAMNGLNADCSNLTVGQMLIIPVPTPASPVSPTATPFAVDLSTHQVSQNTFTSPDGQWHADVLLAQPSASSPRQEDYHHLNMRGPSGVVWAYEQWTDTQTTRTGWSDLKWTAEAVYWYENVSNLDVCHADWSTNLRRMDLTTGAVTTVPGFGPDWQGKISFSPDAPNFASLEGTDLVIRGLDGAQQQRIPFQPIDPNSWGARSLTYQPGSFGVVMVQHRPANLMCSGGPVQEGVVVFDIVNGTSLQQEIPAGYAFRGYNFSGLAYLLGPDGKIYQMDIHTAALELAPDDVQP